MLKGIDISNWQKGFEIAKNNPGFVICKATEGTTFTDSTCDGFIQDAIKADIPFGFYHFAGQNDPEKEASFFYKQTKGYIGKGVPVLDFEVRNSNKWLETWCKAYYKLSKVYPWVYMSANYVNNLGYGTEWLEKHCALWLAGYPTAYIDYPNDTACPYQHGKWALAAWQFTSSLQMGGMIIDGDIFYGSKAAWNKYAQGNTAKSAKSSAKADKLSDQAVLKMATDTIKGLYGTGVKRKKKLGTAYKAVQAKINDLYAKANDVIKGKYGDGAIRKKKLGEEYEIVQYIVDNMLK